MPRKARKEIDTKYYHVMVQGIGKEYVFPNDKCKGFYLTCLHKGKVNNIPNILAFCVMGNHAHMLLHIDNIEQLSKYMRKVNADYARFYNRLHRRVGYVFRDRFRSEPIYDI